MHSCPTNFNIPIFITAYTSIVCSNEAIISLTQDVNDAYDYWTTSQVDRYIIIISKKTKYVMQQIFLHSTQSKKTKPHVHHACL